MGDRIKIETRVPWGLGCIQKGAFQNEITFNSLTQSVGPVGFRHAHMRAHTHTHTPTN